MLIKTGLIYLVKKDIQTLKAGYLSGVWRVFNYILAHVSTYDLKCWLIKQQQKNVEQFRFLENWPPAPPLSQH